MTPDFQTQLRLQLVEAARREERRGGLAVRLPRISPVVAVAAIALVALAVALGGLSLRGTGPEQEPAKSAVSRFSVSPTLGPILNAFGSVWAVDPTGHLLRVDPRTHEVLGTLDVPAGTSIAAAAGTLWVGDNAKGTLIRIDPESGRTVAQVPLRTPRGDDFVANGIAFGDRYAWAYGVDGLLRYDLERNVFDRSLPLDTAGILRGAALADGALWVLARNDRLLELDPETGARRGAIAVHWPDTATFDSEGGVAIEWSTLTGHIARVDLATGRERWTQELGGRIGYWTVHGPDVWVHVSTGTTHDHVVRLDARTGRVLATVALPDLGVTTMAAVGGRLWVGTPNGQIDVVRAAPR